MSYFTLDTDNQKMINEVKRDIPMNDTQEKKVYTKARHTTPHTPESRHKISETQSKRYAMIRQLVNKGQQKQMTEDRVRTICNEVVQEFIEQYTKPIKNNPPININL